MVGGELLSYHLPHRSTEANMRKAFVLHSGGLDSTTCLFRAIEDFTPWPRLATHTRIRHNLATVADKYKDPIDWVEAVSIDYGQRHSKEIEMARSLTADLRIQHTLIDLGNLLSSETTMLTNKDVKIPDVDYSDLPYGVSPTYVPFRNGTMLSTLAAYAQKWVNRKDNGPEDSAGIYFGAHAEDAHNWAYPDCTPEFIGAMANAIYIGSYRRIRLHTPLMFKSKTEVVEFGYALGVPFERTWSCYKGEEKHCGICPTCRSRRSAFRRAGLDDPTEYAHDIPQAAE